MKNLFTPIRVCAIGLVLVLALAGCAASKGSSSADASWMQRMELVMGKANPALQVRVQPSANPVKLDEALKLRVFSNTAGFAYLLQLDGDGKFLRLVFPNAVDDANFMGAGYLDLPRGTWRMPALYPKGVAYLMAVLSPTPLDLPALQAQLAYGRFELMGSYGAAMVPLR
ncbi:MAG: DUF4384 domain-containing protein [Pseudomonadota bacterium]